VALWRGQRALVLGCGITGMEVARVLAAEGASVLVSEKGDVATADAVALEAAGVEIESGGHTKARAELGSFDFVVPSPGIPPHEGFLAEIITEGIKVASDLDLGHELARAPIVAVTGTNGKTTVCRLAAHIGKAAGLAAFACGNLEHKLLSVAHKHPEADLLVVEASSFALTFCRSFRPRVSVITNLAPDHLDWHQSFEKYREAKARIAAVQGHGDLFLYPDTQPELASLAPMSGVHVQPFDASSIKASEVPWAAGAAHFLHDAAAAVAAVIHVGVSEELARRALDGFDLDPHRLALVGGKDGVVFFDDSVSANPHATLAALESMSSPVVLIVGGRAKVPLSPLASQASSLRAVVALGEAAGEIESVFSPTDVIVSIAASMDEAVGMAFRGAQQGDAVLLSPACASWDMFDGYADRGRAFRKACTRLGVG
jgi:UDP-N-acetylmuramoylalanine--D-glutamate ligase